MPDTAGRLLLVIGAGGAVALLGARLLAPAQPAPAATTATPPGSGWNGDGLAITAGAVPQVQPVSAAGGQPVSEPHVSCQFYVQGANIAGAQGMVTLRPWSADGAPAAPAVLTGTYAGTPAAAGKYQFVAGPYLLAAGHYEVAVSASSGLDTRHASFWVDACPSGGPTATPPAQPAAPDQPTTAAQATPDATTVPGATATPYGTVAPTDTVAQI